jgi:hypothetical protein
VILTRRIFNGGISVVVGTMLLTTVWYQIIPDIPCLYTPHTGIIKLHTYNYSSQSTFSSAFEIIYKTLDERHLKKTLSEFHDIICASNFEYCDSIGLGTRDRN